MFEIVINDNQTKSPIHGDSLKSVLEQFESYHLEHALNRKFDAVVFENGKSVLRICVQSNNHIDMWIETM
jgi:hypothetical protein